MKVHKYYPLLIPLWWIDPKVAPSEPACWCSHLCVNPLFLSLGRTCDLLFIDKTDFYLYFETQGKETWNQTLIETWSTSTESWSSRDPNLKSRVKSRVSLWRPTCSAIWHPVTVGVSLGHLGTGCCQAKNIYILSLPLPHSLNVCTSEGVDVTFI